MLFEEDLDQVKPVDTRSKAGGARDRATEQPGQGLTPPPTQPVKSIPLPPSPLQPTEGAATVQILTSTEEASTERGAPGAVPLHDRSGGGNVA